MSICRELLLTKAYRLMDQMVLWSVVGGGIREIHAHHSWVNYLLKCVIIYDPLGDAEV